jgi:hypothetical protein
MAVILTGAEYIDLGAHGAALDIRSRPLSWYVEFESSTTDQIMFLLSHGRSGGAQEYAQLWVNSSQVRSRWNGAVQGQQEVIGANTNDGTPHRFATVVRSSVDTIAQYLDGSSSTSGGTGAGLTTADINDTTAIGRDSGADQFYFVGQVSNVAIWDVELTAQQAADLTAGTIGPLDLPTGLLGFWPLDYDARDESGNDLHGTPVGDPAFTESPPGGETVTLAGTLPALTGAFEASSSADLQLAGQLPALSGALGIESSSSIELAGTLPTLTGAFSIDAIPVVTTTLNGTLPTLAGAFVIDAGAPPADPNPIVVMFTEPSRSVTFTEPSRSVTYQEV